MWGLIAAIAGPLFSFLLGLFKSRASKDAQDETDAETIKKAAQARADSAAPADVTKLQSEYQRD